MKSHSLLLSIALFLVFSTASYAENIMLYKNFHYGQSHSEIAKMPDVKACNEYIKGALCKFEETFAGSKWEQIFIFNKDSLERVGLAQEFDNDDLVNVVGAIVNNDFILVSLQYSDVIFDVIEQAINSKDLSDALNKFESAGLAYGELTYTFIEFQQKPGKQVKNLTQLMATLPENARAVEVMIESDDNTNENYTTVLFTVPLKMAKDMEHNIKSSQDKF